MTPDRDVLILRRSEVRALLSIDDAIAAVEGAFRMLGEGTAAPPGILGFHVESGGFHIKAGWLPLAPPRFAVKTNANFPGNPAARGLPTIQGVIVLADAVDGRPLAVMDGIEITLLRTAAATAVAARRLAWPESSVATVCGCGVQAMAQLQALCRVLPIARVLAVDRDAARAERLADEARRTLGLSAEVVADPGAAARRSDVVVTCTTSTSDVLHPGDVRPGAFVAAVGADHPEKRELHPALLASCAVVVDDLEQCATLGDLHHALEAGALRREDVRATLGEVVAGRARGRTSLDERVVFDSTGLALQDVATASLVYDRARAAGGARCVALAE